MKKFLLSFIAVVVFSTSNLGAYSKAKADSIALEEELEAVFVGVMTAVGALGATGMHVNDWFNGRIDDFNGTAKEYWKSASPAIKQSFIDGLNTAGDYTIVAGDAITGYLDYVGEFYKDLFLSDDAPPPLTDDLGGILKVYSPISSSGYNGTYTLDYSKYMFVISGASASKVYSDKVGVNYSPRGSDYGRIEYNVGGSYQTFKDIKFNSAAEAESFKNGFLSTNGITRLGYFTSYGLSVGVVTRSGDVIYPENKVALELDGVRDYLRDRVATNEGRLKLGVPVDSFATPYNLDGIKLRKDVTTGDLVLPDGGIYSGDLADIVWNPTLPQVIDVGGVPTAVIDTTAGLVDVLTGELVVPADIDKATDGTLGGFFSKLWEFLQSILTAILNLPAKLINLIKTLFIALFVPTDGFWNNNLNQLKALLFGEQIKDSLEELDGLKNPGSGAFKDVSVTIMNATGIIIDSNSINSVLDTIHKWVRGVFFPFLIFYNINSLYKMIRGTSLVEVTRAIRERNEP